MRALIQDRATLEALHPLDLISYLRARGWSQGIEIPDKGAIWSRWTERESPEVFVPRRRNFSDYALRIGELLRTLEEYEQRSQTEVLQDVLTTSSDLIRLRTPAADTGDGSIPLEKGVVFVEQARELILAAACAAVTIRPYWSRRRPPQAIQYLEQVRLGQTEKGSFVLTLLSSVAPELRRPDDETTSAPPPFERHVTETLMAAVSATREAAHRAAASGDAAPFREAVKLGVSANLCDALVGLAHVKPEAGIDIAISWARTRQPKSKTPSHIVFSEDAIPWIEEASRLFKATAPQEDFDLLGYVERLDRSIDATSGVISAVTRIDGSTRKVSIELHGQVYSLAVRAHENRLPVECTGELQRDGRQYRLRNVRDFQVLEL